MNDDEITGRMLEVLYEHRHDSGADLDNLLKPQFPNVPMNVLQSLIRRMEQRHMVELSATIGGLGYGTISNLGIDIVTGKANSPVPIILNQTFVSQSLQVVVGSSNVVNFGSVEKLNAAIDHSDASQQEKTDAKSLLEKILSNPLLLAVLKKFGLSV